MFIIIFIFALAFLVLAAISILKPGLMIDLINRLERKWSIDRELFLNSQSVRLGIGALFLVASLVLFYAAYSSMK
ncbi:MAG: hypothetical protein FJZ10_06755 [Candidatus Omnitrophica bacterium]|nr:hypothetical protein [Candidatus Omnitrophota bacterium]